MITMKKINTLFCCFFILLNLIFSSNTYKHSFNSTNGNFKKALSSQKNPRLSFSLAVCVKRRKLENDYIGYLCFISFLFEREHYRDVRMMLFSLVQLFASQDENEEGKEQKIERKNVLRNSLSMFWSGFVTHISSGARSTITAAKITWMLLMKNINANNKTRKWFVCVCVCEREEMN